MLMILGVTAFLCAAAGAALHLDAGRRTAREEADDLEAARLRLVDAGEDPNDVGVHDCNAHEPRREGRFGPGMYTSSAATAVEVVPIEPPADAWMVKVVADPTLTHLDVVTAVEHVASGVGSLASFAATVEDTRMRTSAEVRELRAAELEAYAAAPAEEDRLFFAGFERRMDRALASFEWATARVDNWAAYLHTAEDGADCEHCHRALRQHSDEFALLLADRTGTDTGVYSLVELRAELAAV